MIGLGVNVLHTFANITFALFFPFEKGAVFYILQTRLNWIERRWNKQNEKLKNVENKKNFKFELLEYRFNSSSLSKIQESMFHKCSQQIFNSLFQNRHFLKNYWMNIIQSKHIPFITLVGGKKHRRLKSEESLSLTSLS